MLLVGFVPAWRGHKPPIQGIGAQPTTRGVTVTHLFVRKTSRARTLRVRMFETPSRYTEYRVTNPRLRVGLHHDVTLSLEDS